MGQLERLQFEEEGPIAFLRLCNWASTPLPVSLFKLGALSSSQSRLALLSYKQQAVIVPLVSRKDGETTLRSESVASSLPHTLSPPASPSNGFSEDYSAVAHTEAPFTPQQLLYSENHESKVPPSSEFRFSLGGSQSTPYRTPTFISRRSSNTVHENSVFPPYTATPYFTPIASTPLCSSSQTSQETAESGFVAESNEPVKVSSSFYVIDNIDCFTWAYCGDDFAANLETEPFKDILFTAGSEGLILHAFCNNNDGVGSMLDNICGSDGQSLEDTKECEDGERNGKWRIWREHEGHTDSVDDRGKRKLSFPDENNTNKDDSRSKEAVADVGVNGGSSFQSFVVDGQLEHFKGGLHLQFLKHYPWPTSAKCISFSLPYTSSSFSLLSKFGQTSTQVEQFSGVTGSGAEEKDLQIARLLSNPAQNLVALLMVEKFAELICEAEIAAEEKHAAQSTMGRVKFLDNFSVVVTGVYCQDLKVLSRIDSRDTKAGLAEVVSWTDFQLSDRVFLALKEDGRVFLWNSFTGSFITQIDVPQFCNVDLKEEIGKETLKAPSGEVDQDPKHGTSEVFASQEKTKTSTTARGSDIGAKNRFYQLTATADCLLLAVCDAKGIVSLVSTDDYFASEAFISSGTRGNRGAECYDLKPLSGYEVAGSDIGGVKYESAVANRNWINLSFEGGNSCATTSTKRGGRTSLPSFGINNSSNCPLGASGFTTKDRVHQYQIRGVGFAHSLQLLRKLFVPNRPSSGFLGMALNPYSITCASANTSEGFILLQNGLYVGHRQLDEAELNDSEGFSRTVSKSSIGNVLTFSFQGCLYIVSQTGLHVVLPPLASRQRQLSGSKWYNEVGRKDVSSKWDCLLPFESRKLVTRQWQTEVLDRCIIFNSLKETEQLCLENGWSIQLMRLRRLQLALNYVKVDEVEQSLEALVLVGAAEAGIPQVLLGAVELMADSFGSDNELAQACRLLELAARFSTRLIRSHGLWQRQHSRSNKTIVSTSSAHFPYKDLSDSKPVGHVSDLARLLEVIRSVQDRLQAKRNGPSRGAKADASNEAFGSSVDLQSKTKPIIEFPPENAVQSVEAENIITSREEQLKVLLGSQDSVASSALVPTGTFHSSGGSWGVSIGGPFDGKPKRGSTVESAAEMFARWENEDVDAENIVRDALRAGRVPLAVVQLHKIRSREFLNGPQTQRPQMIDVFQDVQKIGRGIVYELLCKGKTALAMAALRRLGEEIDVAHYELAFGTVRRGLRKQMRTELRRSSNRLGSRDSQLLEIVLFLENLYPNSSFWSTYRLKRVKSSSHTVEEPSSNEEDCELLQLICGSGAVSPFTLQCGEVDGVVLGSWDYEADPEALDAAGAEQVNPAAGYLVTAAVWLHVWDEVTVGRVVLDQSLDTGEHKSWGAQLEYHVVHNDWPQVSALLDDIPYSVLDDDELRIHLDADEDVEYLHDEVKHPDLDSADEQSPRAPHFEEIMRCVPKVHILSINMRSMCSAWLWHMMEVKLIRSHIFLRTHWQGTLELVSLLASAELVYQRSSGKPSSTSCKQSSPVLGVPRKETFHKDTLRALHELVVRHCVKYSLINLLERYLNYHSLALDKGSVAAMQSAVGNCNWAQWLLLSRLKGREYDASVANALTISRKNLVPNHGLGVGGQLKSMMEEGNLLPNREIVAVSTLMYGPLPIQKCLGLGSVNRQELRPWQCFTVDLQPGLQRFPTVWHTLVAACYGHDAWSFVRPLGPKIGGRMKGLSGYLEWRGTIFKSAAEDVSLIEIMPHWLPTSVRRLIQLAFQGAVGKTQVAMPQTSEITLRAIPDTALRERVVRRADVEMEEAHISDWEHSTQMTIKEELYAVSPEEAGMDVEHYLRRGRPLAAFSSLLSLRAHKSGSFNPQPGRQSSYDPQSILSNITETEESLITSVLSLAILNFENIIVVAACVSFLELCGLSAQLLQVDVAALSRISLYIRDQQHKEGSLNTGLNETAADKDARTDLMRSLVQGLTEEYTAIGIGILSGKGLLNSRPRKPVMAILQLLENSSLNHDGLKKLESNAGAWLMNGVGDGAELRTVQRSMSERWSLVTAFCRGHQLPISTTYLATIARCNDWVGFLAEAQLESCPSTVLISVASKEFSDLRLRSHILTVLKFLTPASPKPLTPHSNVSHFSSGESPDAFENGAPGELFSLLAECETEKQPGRELLGRAKVLRWPLLAVVASCFADVTPLSCLTTWLELTAARETTVIQVNDVFSQVSASVGAAVEATNAQLDRNTCVFGYDWSYPKKQRSMSPKDVTTISKDQKADIGPSEVSLRRTTSNMVQEVDARQKSKKITLYVPSAAEEQESLAAMVAVLCEQQRFVPLLRAFELFTPSSPLLPFICFLQAFAQMRISDAGAQLASFSHCLKEDQRKQHSQHTRSTKSNTMWITAAAVAAADAMLDSCPSPYEHRCLLQLLSAADFGDGGSAAIRFRKLYWKMQLAEPSLRSRSGSLADAKNLDDDALLQELEKNGQWEESRSWAGQLDLSSQHTRSAFHHVTETQAEAMVEEWKELLWDVPEERAALWSHCQALFMRHSYPSLQAGLFYLKHANAVEGQVPTSELHSILLLALQWLSGSFNDSSPVYPLHLLHELEIRVWLLAVEAKVEAQTSRDQETVLLGRSKARSTIGLRNGEPGSGNPVDLTANAVAAVDSHLRKPNTRSQIESSADDNGRKLVRSRSVQTEEVSSSRGGSVARMKRRTKQLRRTQLDNTENGAPSSPEETKRDSLDRRNSFDRPESFNRFNSSDDREVLNRHHSLSVVQGQIRGTQINDAQINLAEDNSSTPDEETRGWEERVGEGEVERAVLALVEVGQVPAARQLQLKLAPTHVPLELLLVEAAQKIATLSMPTAKWSAVPAFLHPTVVECLLSTKFFDNYASVTPMQVLNALTNACREGCGRGHCRRIAAVAQISHFLGLTFTEASSKTPPELLQLLSLKGKEAFSEAKLLVDTHSMPAPAIARILAESHLKGLLAAHRGGFMESSFREEGPAPLLWRSSDFKAWAELCPVESEIGHALMRLVISGRDIPHSCEVELIILAHHYYELSACLDGIDVLVSLVSTRVDLYVVEGEFALIARLVTGVSNFHRLRFILDVLIEHGSLQLLLQKKPFFDPAIEASPLSVRGFCMAVLAALKRFNVNDQDALMQVYNHFNMPQEMAILLLLRARKSVEKWVDPADPEYGEDVLESMRLYVEAAEAFSNISAGMNTSMCCAQASLLSLQLRMPELTWLNLSETNARRRLVERPRFEEALIVAKAYDLNQTEEWVPVLWNQMLQPGRIDQYLSDFVEFLPLPFSMLMELARFYRAEVSARGDHLDHYSKWLTPGGTPPCGSTYLAKSMRFLLKLVRDIRSCVQLAIVATGFSDIVDAGMQALDKVPDSAGPLILRKGHGGTYIPLM
ncbi:uncharacterized protein [Physcomitrium patens]|uniref:Spatacsin C-terminal domain-containing protein n=1 Tax=Physcomitrium patens TaxID=3218 RepID=A0A7I4FMM9_PHYPA|nr:uncharacterized protein LOC112280545 isoform X2 [Physcomitrium patens]|eukprot:XP_024371913.1 uncharacterized protein LOC112280545 isoform X2 [Physcomitrella patens]